MPKIVEPKTALGREIRDIRKRLRYSQDVLAEMVGTTDGNWSRWETGVVIPPTPNLVRLSEIAGRTVDEKNEIYWRLSRLAGYGALGRQVGAVPAASEALGGTTEGTMGKAIIDRVRNPRHRLDLVVHLAHKAAQLQEGDGGNAPAGDSPRLPQALPASHDGDASPETPP